MTDVSLRSLCHWIECISFCVSVSSTMECLMVMDNWEWSSSLWTPWMRESWFQSCSEATGGGGGPCFYCYFTSIKHFKNIHDLKKKNVLLNKDDSYFNGKNV